MPETYCTKACNDCAHREHTGCPGCKVGPGNQASGDCNLADCCRSKGHLDCTTCTLSDHCGIFLSRRDMPARREKKQEADTFLADERIARASFFSRWMILLLAAAFVATLGFLLATLRIHTLEWIRYPAVMIGFSFGGAYGIVLLWLSKQEEKYRAAGICMLVAAALCLIAVIFFRNDRFILPLFFLFSFIIAIIAVFFEIKGHVSALTGLDHNLATKWEKLLMCHLCLFGAFFARILFVKHLSTLGDYVFSLLTLAWLVVLCVHFTYVFLTARRFLLHVKKKG